MIRISEKTLADLDFQYIKDAVAELCHNELAIAKAQQLVPIENRKRLVAELHFVQELLDSFSSEHYFPSLDFETITAEITLLNIEDSFLEVVSFLRLKKITQTAIEVIQFVAKLEMNYPYLHILTAKVPIRKEIIQHINKIFTKYGDIKDDATPELAIVRQQIASHHKAIATQFKQELKTYGSQDFLDTIQESVIDEKRVLAVKAAYRKRVAGIVLGQSKTGSIVFVEPDSMMRLNRQLQQFREDERAEIIQILRALTNELRTELDVLGKYQSLLAHLDFVRAKALFAAKINGKLPIISPDKKLVLYHAYHPVLYMRNQEEGLRTIPQTISLTQEHRIISISGPNAGGKSIALKTVGLLQIMLQSALLIPVESHSELGFFDTILTDIGDNQSIENHLSTYSYRLKQMKHFLRAADENTLFLIDEFGTGSDPELGGALAEVFIEELYEKGATGHLNHALYQH